METICGDGYYKMILLHSKRLELLLDYIDIVHNRLCGQVTLMTAIPLRIQFV